MVVWFLNVGVMEFVVFLLEMWELREVEGFEWDYMVGIGVLLLVLLGRFFRFYF